jgi:hypothetical protein
MTDSTDHHHHLIEEEQAKDPRYNVTEDGKLVPNSSENREIEMDFDEN